MDYSKLSLEMHKAWKGKLEIKSKVKVRTNEDLSVAYTPGVASACLAIKDNPALAYELTGKWNSVAVITDSSAILGLGNIGAQAGMPVMEGKCLLFKEFADIDAVPLCIDTNNIEDIIKTVSLISKSFGGINLEDIAAPACFEVEQRLKEICDIPVFHDDQHGTAVIVTAAIINSLKLTGKNKENCKAVICGAGAAGTAIANMLFSYGIKDIIVCNKKGILNKNRTDLSDAEMKLASFTNISGLSGSLADAMTGADIFIGVSAPSIVSGEMIKSMNSKPVVFAMANPVPEIMPEVAKENGAWIVGTGRSDYPNQVNNVLAFPGIFRGALDVRATQINEEMKLSAAHAIAELVSEEELSCDYILPLAFDRRVGKAVADAVAAAAVKTGVSRI